MRFYEYKLYHCSDIKLTCNALFDIIPSMKVNVHPETNLKRIRVARGYSQKQLAELSGVSLRAIQTYEQRQKDINKAQSDSLHRLAKALDCKMEDLLENA